ncbi:MAG: nucleotidyl transferase AbiEii/AbiGii toxin family protein [Coriobacteriales bacterium]|jgi:predicted nucleotidyltransferase component of viral defense system|nr:nucleotidyl transferase AbiEii/AbiGii toxin family protein [Coriobacteriales bacterium]
MENNKFPIDNPRRLKDWVNNMAKKNNLVANTVLQNYMMERFLERVSVSKYRDNFILKGGFLIAAMVGIDMRSTMDMDTTIKGILVSQSEIEKIVSEILAAPINDNVTFEIKSIKPIHEAGGYEDFRLGIVATFFAMRVDLKLDITTGDIVIPREVDYSFKLMFEDRSIQVKAYNINTILAEKIESILARNVANTRARDYYDVYILLTTRRGEIDRCELLNAITLKAVERGTLIYIKQHVKYLSDIRESRDLLALWNAYRDKYPYAEGIEFSSIVDSLVRLFE